METKNISPNYIEKEESNNEKLRDELENLLEKELEKSPDDINTKKVVTIVQLLDEMDGRGNKDSTDKDEFAKKYLQDYIKMPKKAKVYKFSQKKMRLASAILIFAVLFGLSNYVSVRATDQGILKNIKESVDRFYFEVIKYDESETVDLEKYSELENKIEMTQWSYNTWEAVKNGSGYIFKIPYYIPAGFTMNKIYLQKIGEHDFEISTSYYKTDKYIKFYVRCFSEEGKFSTLVEDLGDILYEKTIGEFYVKTYLVQDSIQAFFQEESCFYAVETNLDENELEKIIMEIRR